MKNFIPLILLVFFALLIGIAMHKASLRDGSEPDAQGEVVSENNLVSSEWREEKTMLPEFSLSDLYDSEAEFSKKDLVGKYSLINFFASWCATCVAEHEVLVRLSDEKLLDIYGVAWRDISGETKEYLRRYKNPFKKVGNDSKGLFTKILNIKAIPETVLVDPSGKVVMRFKGNLREESVEEMRRFVRGKR